jgi:hypothetical protein
VSQDTWEAEIGGSLPAQAKVMARFYLKNTFKAKGLGAWLKW